MDNSYECDEPPAKKTNTPKKKRAARNELTAKEKERVNRKLFRQEWLNHEDFKYWLKEIPNNKLKCKCIACNIILSCGKSELEKHNKGKKHSDNVKSLRGLKNMSSFVNRPSETSTKEFHVVKTAEIKLAAFFAENNVAFQLVDKLAPLLKEIFNDSNTAQKLQLHRHKCTSIVKNIIAPVELEETVQIIQNNPFSVLVDESTDISTRKLLCILVRFVHPEDWKIHTRLLELKAIDATDCSAQKLCEEFKECLKSKDVSFSNLIGVASDGANVMIGKNNSFFSHLKSDLPNLVLMQCICHSSALAASKATALLPRSAEDLIRSVSTYISGSAKRTAIIEEIQEFFGEQKKKILKLADTRWLAMHQCVVRILDCWNSLTHYFLVAVSEDHLKSAITILDALNNCIVKAYFYFLKYSLNFFNSFNAMFQTQNIMIHKMYTNSVNLLKTFAQNFIKPEFLMTDSLEQLSFSDPKIFLPESEIFVGTECEDFLKTLPQNIVSDFKNTCLKFYIKSTEEITRRLPIKSEFFKEIAFLDPNICLDPTNRSMIKDLHHTRKTFEQYIDNNKVIEEWRGIPYFYNKEQIAHLKKMSISEMWYEISTAKDYASDNFKFPNICILARLVLCLPHSNAAAERIFSIVNDVKSKKRNKLGDDTMNAVTTIRSSFKDKEITCNNFKVTQKHINMHNQNMYSAKI